ncbi:MAG: 1-acyl-sn-glycerol-3-phosphate acyltransferase [Candidatus Sericytochromatia bacterium]|nr:1-acyl-sn-glycerol-3-phosphate acyltransferase [Candidatus Tanganyikabacteria bacterium]
MLAVRSVWAWSVLVAWCLIFIPAIAIALVALPRHVAFRFSQWSCRFAFSFIGVRVLAVGEGNWDPDRAYVMMGNHVNFLDPFVMACAFPRYMVAIEKRENFKIPFYGFLMKRWGNIPIDRKNRETAMRTMEEAAVSARDDASWIVIMPEGTRTRTGKMGPFKKGGFYTALAARLPIAPYSLVGSWDVMRTGKGGWLIRPGTIEVHMHPPIETSGYDATTMDELMDRVRAQIAVPLGEAESRPRSFPPRSHDTVRKLDTRV